MNRAVRPVRSPALCDPILIESISAGECRVIATNPTSNLRALVLASGVYSRQICRTPGECSVIATIRHGVLNALFIIQVYNELVDPQCSVCHALVRPTDYFCYNCGKNIHEKLLSTSRFSEFLYYAASLLLPPIGIWWGIKYLKQDSRDSKRIGVICIVLTVLSSLIVTVWSVQLIRGINTQVNQQLQSIEGL